MPVERAKFGPPDAFECRPGGLPPASPTLRCILHLRLRFCVHGGSPPCHRRKLVTKYIVEKVRRRRKRRPATPCVFEITLNEKRPGWLFLRDVFAAGCGDERFGKPLAFSESPSAEKGQDGFFRVKLLQQVDQQPATKLGLKPGALWRHHFASIRDRHQLFD